jgi:outer membrane protein assembly factor BamB
VREATDGPLIELDVSSPWEPPEQERPRRRQTRWIAGALVLAALLAGLGRATVAASVHPLVALNNDGIMDYRVAGNTLYVLRTAAELPPGGRRFRLEAHPIRPGGARWSHDLPGAEAIIAVAQGRVIVPFDDDPAVGTPILVALDAATGAEVWHRAGYTSWFWRTTGDNPVMTAVAAGAQPNVDDQPPAEVKMVGLDVRTGDEAWHLDPRPGVVRQSELDGDAIRTADLAPDGTLTVYDDRTGAVTRTARLLDPGAIGGFDLHGNWLLAYQNGPGGPQNTSLFDLRTGQRAWQSQDAGQPDPHLLYWCGDVLCSADRTGTVALDPATLNQLWTLPGNTGFAVPPGPDLVSFGAQPSDDGRLPVPAEVLDRATGQVVRRFTGWEVLSADMFPHLVAINRTTAGSAQLGLLDVDTGGVRVFGTITGFYGAPMCDLSGAYVTCKGKQLVVFEVPRVPGVRGADT